MCHKSISFATDPAVCAASLILAGVGPSIIGVPSEMMQPARLAIIATGVSFGVNLTFGVFGAVLAGLGRFDVLSGVTICRTVLGALGIVVLLQSGYGIVGLAVWELLVTALANTATTILSLRVYREVRVVHDDRPDG